MDTTPSTWAPLEAEDSTILQPFMDLLSWIRYKLTGDELNSEKDPNNWMLWILIPLMAFLAWRFYNKQRVNTKKTSHAIFHANIKRFGLDSPIYPLLKRLEQDTDKRLPGETLSKWIKRILPIEKAEKYSELIKLHNRYRFNPTSNKRLDKESILKKADTDNLIP